MVFEHYDMGKFIKKTTLNAFPSKMNFFFLNSPLYGKFIPISELCISFQMMHLPNMKNNFTPISISRHLNLEPNGPLQVFWSNTIKNAFTHLRNIIFC